VRCRHFNGVFLGYGVGVFGSREGLGIFLSLFSALLFLVRELLAGRQQGCAMIVYKDFFVCDWGGGRLGICDICIRELG